MRELRPGELRQLTSVYQSPGVVGLPLLQTLPLPAELLHVVGPVLPRLHLHHTEVGVREAEPATGGAHQHALPALPRVLRHHGGAGAVCREEGGGGVGRGRHQGVDGVVDGGHHAVVVVGVLEPGPGEVGQLCGLVVVTVVLVVVVVVHPSVLSRSAFQHN